MRCNKLFSFFLLIFLSFSIPARADTSGIYLLELVYSFDSGKIKLQPIAIYDDPQWGFYLCHSEKDDIQSWLNSHGEYKFVVTCASYRKYEL